MKEKVQNSRVVEDEAEEKDAWGWELRLYQARGPGESRRESGRGRSVGGREEAYTIPTYTHILMC